MKQFECGQVVDGCDGVVQGETEEEVMQAAAAHAKQTHGIDEVPDDLAAQIRAGIHDA